jgi:3,4-dihydroxy 2-butanone 4-phosphate synthase/GTP cyclohydrolase II
MQDHGSQGGAMELNSVTEALEATRRGEMIVVMDDDDRENEGDLILAASHATPEKIAFIVRHTSGIVCAPLTQSEARRFQLDPMVGVNDAPLHTAFTVSIDLREGLTTGISAEERCATVRALANPNSGAADFVRPGHVFPLIANEGGVLMRSGHTEAAVDLARLAGLAPVGVLAELVNDDGTVKRGPEVVAFAREHGLVVITIADLIAYRQRRERLVERIGEFEIRTKIGPARAIAYSTPFDPVQHMALVFGEIGGASSVLVRFHREDVIADVFAVDPAIDLVLDRIKQEGSGVIVYLREGTAGVASEARAKRPRSEHTESEVRRREHWREIGLGAQILYDLGITSIRLLASTERQYVGLSGFGLTIESSEWV